MDIEKQLDMNIFFDSLISEYLRNIKIHDIEKLTSSVIMTTLFINLNDEIGEYNLNLLWIRVQNELYNNSSFIDIDEYIELIQSLLNYSIFIELYELSSNYQYILNKLSEQYDF